MSISHNSHLSVRLYVLCNRHRGYLATAFDPLVFLVRGLAKVEDKGGGEGRGGHIVKQREKIHFSEGVFSHVQPTFEVWREALKNGQNTHMCRPRPTAPLFHALVAFAGRDGVREIDLVDGF